MSSRFANFAALAVSASMIAAPIAAADLPIPAVRTAVATTGIFDPDATNADNHRRYRRDRVDAGDVIGGLVVIGAIAAVASAASNASRNDRYRDRDYRYRDGDYGYRGDYRRSNSRYGESRGLQNAADMCAREIDRDRRVSSVDSVVRSADGWRVTGRVRTGEGFSCLIGNDGRIADIDFGSGGYSGVTVDGQWDDGRYAAARAAHESGGAMPAYPGGPVQGDLVEVPPVGSTASDYDS